MERWTTRVAYPTEEMRMCVEGAGSVLVVGGLETIRTRQYVSQLCGIVNQDGKVLGADPETGALVLEGNEGDVFRAPFTDQTSHVVLCHVFT